MRTFEHQKTHPWLAFEVDLRKAPVSLWLNLGEAASKCEHLSRTPLRSDTRRHLHQVSMIKGAAATTAIEGNTLTEEEVGKLAEGTLRVPPSMEYQKQEVQNVLDAFGQISQQLATGPLPPISSQLIKDFNRQVLHGLTLDKDVVPGKLRTHSVLVGNVYKGAPAKEGEYLLNKLCDWLNDPDFAFPEKDKSTHTTVVRSLFKAVLAHLYLAWIHPFGDGNGRTARLMEFYLLLGGGIPFPAALILSNYYNKTRADYYRQLDYASKSKGDVVPFLCYAVQGFVEGLTAQLEVVWKQVFDLVWRDYVSLTFQTQEGASAHRQQRLVVELGVRVTDVSLADIPLLTPELARDYAGKTAKTIQRDVNALEKLGLLTKAGRSVYARREVLSGFLPLRNQASHAEK